MKKANKKAILGFAMSMIFSLAVMQGISQKNVQQHDKNLQQIGAALVVGAAYGASEDPGMAAAVGFTGGMMLNFVAESCPVWGSMGPVGWVVGGGMAL